MTRPIKELKGFKKVYIPQGETVEVSFDITPEMLSGYYIDPFGHNLASPLKTLEPGDFEIMIGPDSRVSQTAILQVLDK